MRDRDYSLVYYVYKDIINKGNPFMNTNTQE